jgi:hypothetical protein
MHSHMVRRAHSTAAACRAEACRRPLTIGLFALTLSPCSVHGFSGTGTQRKYWQCVSGGLAAFAPSMHLESMLTPPTDEMDEAMRAPIPEFGHVSRDRHGMWGREEHALVLCNGVCQYENEQRQDARSGGRTGLKSDEWARVAELLLLTV